MKNLRHRVQINIIGNSIQFFDLYETASKHLKNCFPELKIGGPALAGDLDWGKDFLIEMKKRGAPLDFFSWHCYASTVEKVKSSVEYWRNTLDDFGYNQTESILNEWNYVRGWVGEEWIDSIRIMKNYKGAAFIAGVIEECQNSDLNMLMYYDARPSAMNGMFNTDLVCDRLKGYYPFYMFNQLYILKNSVEVKSLSENLYGCAASNGTDSAIMVTYYNDTDNADEDIEIEIIDPNNKNGAEIECYLLDENNDNKLIQKETFNTEKYSIMLTLKMYTTLLIKIRNK